MNYTRILMSASMIAFVTALVFGGTQAFFSDEEVSEGNFFTAGAIDLQIDNTSYGFDYNDPENQAPVGDWGPNLANSWEVSDLTNQLFFSFVDLKPGDYGEDTISIHVDDNDAWACMAMNLTGTPEHGQNEPEAAVDPTAGDDEGELQNYLSFLFWYDDGDNVYEDDEIVIPELSGLPGSIFSGDWLPIAEAGDDPLAGDTTHYIGKGWCFGEMIETPVAQDDVNDNPPDADTDRIGFTCDGSGDHNDAQTDGIEVDVAFYAEQSRNNDQFSCSDLDPIADNRDPIGAVLSVYQAPAPESCDVTVDDDDTADFSTIQAAIDDGSTVNGDTICVADGTYDENVNINKEITLLGDGAANTSVINAQGGNQTAAVSITADNVTVQGFELNGASDGTAVVYINSAVDNILVDSNILNVGSPDGFLTVGGVSNVTVSNNEFVGDGVNALRLAYVNGLASVSTDSSNVDFFDNTFGGTLDGTLAMGHEGSGSEVRRNVFDLTPSYALIEAWTDSVIITTNNFNGEGGTKVAQMENGNTGAQGTVDASGNWWGDVDPADNIVNDVDTSDAQASAYPEN